MIKEDYASYEVAKLLEEKGFPIIEHLFMYVNKDGNLMTDHQACLKMTNEEYRAFFDDYIPTVTQALAMKWLREEKNIFIIIEPHLYDYINEKNKSYVCSLWQSDNYYENLLSKDFSSYEETVEAALKFCLTELI